MEVEKRLEQLKADLKPQEATVAKLWAERESLESRIFEANQNKEPWRVDDLAEQLTAVIEQIGLAEIEASRTRIELAEIKLSEAIAARDSLRQNFNQLEAKYITAGQRYNFSRYQLANALADVSGLESHIRENQKRIEESERMTQSDQQVEERLRDILKHPRIEALLQTDDRAAGKRAA